METVVFPTFFHINDYDERGYALLASHIATSYPLVLWAPSGVMLEEYHQSKICPISPEQFLRFIEVGYIHVIARDWWFDKDERNRRSENGWRGLKWLDGFDDALDQIRLERENASPFECSVRIVPPQKGPEWAKKYVDEKGQQVIERVADLIRQKKVPEGVLQKALRELTKESEKAAVEMVLRDLKNHVEAKNDAQAKVFFLSQNDADFFRLIEAEGSIPVAEDIVISADMGRAIETLVERLQNPEHVHDLQGFVGSTLHRELASWFGQAVDAAHMFLPVDYSQKLQDRLFADAARGKLSRRLTQALRQKTLFSTPTVRAEQLIALFAKEIMDRDNRLGISGISVETVSIGSGFSRDIELVPPEDERPFWPCLEEAETALSSQ